ncbi:MAG: hypothetical protein ACLP8S_19925 [Solirubrobacteraceae bacterium]
MSEDPIDRIRRLNPVPDDIQAPPLGNLPVHRELHSARFVRSDIRIRVLVPVLATVTVVAIATAALLTLRHHRSVQSAARLGAVPADAQQLVSKLGVLRRPQTAADLDSRQLQLYLARRARNPFTALRGTPIRSLIRSATTSYGPVFLVPMMPVTPQTVAQLPAGMRALDHYQLAHLSTTAELGLLGPGGGDCCLDATDLANTGMSLLTGDPSSTLIVLVVPDGVTNVTVLEPRQEYPGGHIYQQALAVSASVHDNVAALEVNRTADDVDTAYMIWYGPAGNIVKRIGDPADLATIKPPLTRPPQPSPPTVLSRAAQRDPATPNPVWVTPTVGGPSTDFAVSFRALLNRRAYTYRISGPGGPGCHGKTPPSTGGDQAGGLDDVRGQIYTNKFAPETGDITQTRWCPGTFHVSVSVSGTRAWPPFGSATFTVKP